MTASEMINIAIAESKMMKKDIAAEMGWSPTRFSNKIKRGSLYADEFIKMSNLLGYSVTMNEINDNDEERVCVTIDGEIYDTSKSQKICRTMRVADEWSELYRDVSSGAFFTVQRGGWKNRRVIVTPVDKREAAEFRKACVSNKDMK